MTRALLTSGWTVIATHFSEGSRTRLDRELNEFPDRLFLLKADLLAEDGVRHIAEMLDGTGRQITHLVNNARSLEALAVMPDGRTTRRAFLQEFELDVAVAYDLVMTLAVHPAHDLKCVVNIGSQYGIVAPNPALYEGDLTRSPVQYGVAKAALHHLTKELAVRLASQNIRVNSVALGGVEGRAQPSIVSRYSAMVPNQRMLAETEIVGPVEFLLGEASSAVNGHVLVADGGWSIW
jgi:NAD(P)-dependent dehydrogenase (short-subunit alcohol dehydrogenase family)